MLKYLSMEAKTRYAARAACNLISIAALLVTASCATASTSPSSPDASTGLPQMTMPTLTPPVEAIPILPIPLDPSLSAPAFCGKVETNVTSAVQEALLKSGSGLTLPDIIGAHWYLALAHNGSIFSGDVGPAITNPGPNSHFNIVGKNDPACVSPDEVAARLRLGVSISDENGNSR